MRAHLCDWSHIGRKQQRFHLDPWMRSGRHLYRVVHSENPTGAVRQPWPQPKQQVTSDIDALRIDPTSPWPRRHADAQDGAARRFNARFGVHGPQPADSAGDHRPVVARAALHRLAHSARGRDAPDLWALSRRAARRVVPLPEVPHDGSQLSGGAGRPAAPRCCSAGRMGAAITSCATIRASRRSAASCARPASTSCLSCSTSCAAKCTSSARGRSRCPRLARYGKRQAPLPVGAPGLDRPVAGQRPQQHHL